MENYPGIFNDVIGPVMRGPSNYHFAASLRIGRLCRDYLHQNVKGEKLIFEALVPVIAKLLEE